MSESSQEKPVPSQEATAELEKLPDVNDPYWEE